MVASKSQVGEKSWNCSSEFEKMGGVGGGMTYKGVSVQTPKTWHTVAGKGLCGVMWYISIF